MKFEIQILIFVAAFHHGTDGLTGPENPRGSHSHMARQHHHPNPKKDGATNSLLGDRQLLQDVEHLKEELPVHISEKDIEEMSPQELEFHFLKAHDLDSDNHLDGLEMMIALSHVFQGDEYPLENFDVEERAPERERRINSFHNKLVKECEEMIDLMLRDYDANKDGYISYQEYTRASEMQFPLNRSS